MACNGEYRGGPANPKDLRYGMLEYPSLKLLLERGAGVRLRGMVFA